MTASQPDRLDRIEAEIERMLSVQRELQESQIRQEDRMNRLAETTERNSEAIAILERSVTQLVTVVTAHQDSMEQLKRTTDYLISKDGGGEL